MSAKPSADPGHVKASAGHAGPDKAPWIMIDDAEWDMFSYYAGMRAIESYAARPTLGSRFEVSVPRHIRTDCEGIRLGWVLQAHLERPARCRARRLCVPRVICPASPRCIGVE